eukprot:TRINITY_DN96393_c0_g1_i1.p1 TRINITY_DN96393_c0_g1~~TRINITY_DN96393_c0_g1_i1.p1  ORF type:complete len:145 (-),score=38.46 TRINITY_DN96393_c0_g1_i1:55-489(-)
MANKAAVEKATKAAKAQTKGTEVMKKKVRTSVVIRRKKTLELKRSPKFARKSSPKKASIHTYNIIKSPLFSDSSMKQIEDNNTLVFLVNCRSTKKQIKEAVKALYEVEAHRVNTLIRPDGQKKAYVRFSADVDALDIANKIGLI